MTSVRRRSTPPPGLAAAARAVAAHPELWAVAASTALRLAPTGWWRRWPPLPYPDPSYWRFRMVTAYGGDGDGGPDAADVVDFLRWCRERRRGAPASRGATGLHRSSGGDPGQAQRAGSIRRSRSDLR